MTRSSTAITLVLIGAGLSIYTCQNNRNYGATQPATYYGHSSGWGISRWFSGGSGWGSSGYSHSSGGSVFSTARGGFGSSAGHFSGGS